jgi:hypothetical protein
MSCSVKGGKLARNYPKLGEKIVIEYGRDVQGQWWWVETSRGDHTLRGPFRTEAEAQRDSEVTVVGPKCKINHGGVWDPAWDSLQ